MAKIRRENQLRLVVYQLISHNLQGFIHPGSLFGVSGIPEPPPKKKVSSHPAGDEFAHLGWWFETSHECIKVFLDVGKDGIHIPWAPVSLRKNAWQKVLFFSWGAKAQKTGPIESKHGSFGSRGVPGTFILPLSLEEVWFWKAWTQTLVCWV